VGETTRLVIYADQSAAGKTATLMYSFNEKGLLASIVLLFQEEHAYDNLFIDDFISVDTALNTKYGVPKKIVCMCGQIRCLRKIQIITG
jgi:hypothetical protein